MNLYFQNMTCISALFESCCNVQLVTVRWVYREHFTNLNSLIFSYTLKHPMILEYRYKSRLYVFLLGLKFWPDSFQKVRISRTPPWEDLSPEGTLRKQDPVVSIWQSFHFIVFEKRFWQFQNPKFQSAFLKCWKCFIPRRDSAAKAEPNGVPLILFPFYCV